MSHFLRVRWLRELKRHRGNTNIIIFTTDVRLETNANKGKPEKHCKQHIENTIKYKKCCQAFEGKQMGVSSW